MLIHSTEPLFTGCYRYVKDKISIAPNNASAWNYLRGVLDFTKTPYSSLKDFVLPYTNSSHATSSTSDIVDLENPLPAPGADLPCPIAVEFLGDIYESNGGADIEKAVEVCGSTITQSHPLTMHGVAMEETCRRVGYRQEEVRDPRSPLFDG